MNKTFPYIIKDVSDSKVSELQTELEALRGKHEHIQTVKTELEKNLEHQQVTKRGVGLL